MISTNYSDFLVDTYEQVYLISMMYYWELILK